MKIYIVGALGSGKSTLAQKMAKTLEIPVYSLDDVIYERHVNSDRERSDQEITAILDKILAEENFIVEDIFRPQFSKITGQVDYIIYLDLPKFVIKTRIVKRVIKQKCGLDKSQHKRHLRALKYVSKFEAKRSEIESLPHLVQLTSCRQVKNFMMKIEKSGLL